MKDSSWFSIYSSNVKIPFTILNLTLKSIISVVVIIMSMAKIIKMALERV